MRSQACSCVPTCLWPSSPPHSAGGFSALQLAFLRAQCLPVLVVLRTSQIPCRDNLLFSLAPCAGHSRSGCLVCEHLCEPAWTVTPHTSLFPEWLPGHPLRVAALLPRPATDLLCQVAFLAPAPASHTGPPPAWTSTSFCRPSLVRTQLFRKGRGQLREVEVLTFLKGKKVFISNEIESSL